MKGLGYFLLDAAYYWIAAGCVFAAYRLIQRKPLRNTVCIVLATAFLALPVKNRVDFYLAKKRFEYLCATQAGEKIYKTVEGVDGLMIMRPRPVITSRGQMGFWDHDALWDLARDQFKLEDPYSFEPGEDASRDFYYLHHYNFVEEPSGPKAVISSTESRTGSANTDFEKSIYGDSGKPTSSHQEYLVTSRVKLAGKAEKNFPHGGNRKWDKKCSDYRDRKRKNPDLPQDGSCYIDHYGGITKVVAVPRSRYGYTWREVTTREDREKWIGGGEIAVTDLQTGEILATKTGFLFAKFPRRPRGQATWLIPDHVPGRVCPPTDGHGKHKQSFILKVLKPLDPLDKEIEYLEEDRKFYTREQGPVGPWEKSHE